MNRLILFLFVLSLVSTKTLHCQDTIPRLVLASDKKAKTIYYNRVLVITASGLQTSGTFQYRDKNSLFLTPFTQVNSNGEVKFFDEKSKEKVQINLSEIDKIVYERSSLGTVAALGCWTGLGTAIIVSPLVSIKKGGGFDGRKCLTISGIALGATIISAGVIVCFTERTFYLKVNEKQKRIWTIKN